MKRGTMAAKSGVLAGSVALAVLVGCTAAPVAPNATENVQRLGSGGSGTLQTPVNNQTPAQPGTPAQPAAIDDQPAVVVDAGLDSAPAMKISAAAGGRYASADGTLEAIFPPGALSEDTEVRMLPLATDKRKNSSVLVNGMRFQLDMGKAFIKPGTQVMVTSRADKRFVGELQSMYADFTPERYSLTQDAKGNWNIGMPLKGASLTSDPVPDVDPIKGDRRGIMHEGKVPLPPAKGSAFKRNSRIEAFCDYSPPPPPPPPVEVCANVTWESDDPDLEGKPAEGAFVSFGTSVPVLNNNGWEANPNLLNPDVVVWTSQNAQGNWQQIVPPLRQTTSAGGRGIAIPESDADYKARLEGMGFRQRTRRNTIAGFRQIVVASNTATGLPEIQTDATGTACTWFRQFTPVGMTASITSPIPSKARGGAGFGSIDTLVAGDGKIGRLTVVKYSPEITIKINMTDGIDIKSPLKLTCTLDGVPLPGGPIIIGCPESPVDPGCIPPEGWRSKDVAYTFFQRLPDDNEHTFKVEGMLSDDGLMGADPRAATMEDLKMDKTIQRNGLYEFKINAASIAPK